jgi:glycosyltransferase involved in cell wall biosynthesis
MPANGKVLMVIENCPVPADSRVWAEATALREKGFEVSVIGPKGETYDREAYICLEGVHLYRYNLPSYTNKYIAYLFEYGLSMIKTAWLSLRVLRKHGFDVIHAANPPDTFFFLAWFYRLLGKRFIFDQHDLSPEVFRVKFGGRTGLLFKILLWLEKRSYRASAFVLTTNEAQRQVAITRGRCDPEKVFVVRNGPKLDRLFRVPAEPELKGGYPFLLAYIGAMEVQDGIDYALRAMHELVHNRERRDVFLVLMGDGGHLPALKQLAHELKIEDFVHFTGWVNDPEIVRYLSTADVGLCPDPQNGLNEYCTMVKTMEYMAMSLPIVAFDLAETRYTAQDAALYATPNLVPEFADQIEQILDDPELRQSMGKRARTLIEERLSWDYDKQNLLRAYATIFPEISVTDRSSLCPADEDAVKDNAEPSFIANP